MQGRILTLFIEIRVELLIIRVIMRILRSKNITSYLIYSLVSNLLNRIMSFKSNSCDQSPYKPNPQSEDKELSFKEVFDDFFRMGAENLKGMKQEEAKVEDYDEGNMDDIWDITVKDVERLKQLLTPTIHTLPEPNPVVQPLLNVLVEGLEIVNFLLDNFPFHGRVGLSIDLSEEMGSLVVVEHHSKKKEWDEGGGIVRARVVSIVAWCGCGEASLEVSLKSWNLKNGKKPTVEPAGRCLWPNNIGLLQRAPANADDELNWPSFDTLNLETRVKIQEANVLNSKKDYGELSLFLFC
ncbi:hypothetical protein Tco_1064990 [Tanacetum coccineum]